MLACFRHCYAVQGVEAEDEILKCDHLNEICWAAISCGSLFAMQGGSDTFEAVDRMKSLSVTI